LIATQASSDNQNKCVIAASCQLDSMKAAIRQNIQRYV
jgi:hypothetical protein